MSTQKKLIRNLQSVLLCPMTQFSIWQLQKNAAVTILQNTQHVRFTSCSRVKLESNRFLSAIKPCKRLIGTKLRTPHSGALGPLVLVPVPERDCCALTCSYLHQNEKHIRVQFKVINTAYVKADGYQHLQCGDQRPCGKSVLQIHAAHYST